MSDAESGAPTLAYARMLFESQAIIEAGQNNGPKSIALADRMDGPWYAMSRQEQARLGGLSEDIYSLAEGGPKQVEMTADERAAWDRALIDAHARFDAGDADALLGLLRKPCPSTFAGHAVRFLQARCWEHLGDLPTALAFLRDAERKDAAYAGPVLALLQRMGEREGAARQLHRLLALPETARHAG